MKWTIIFLLGFATGPVQYEVCLRHLTTHRSAVSHDPNVCSYLDYLELSLIPSLPQQWYLYGLFGKGLEAAQMTMVYIASRVQRGHLLSCMSS